MSKLAETGLTEEQRLFAEANGYLVVPGALDGDEFTRLQAAAERAESEWRGDSARPGWRRENIEQVQSIIEYGDEFLELAAHPRIFPVVRDPAG